MDHSQKYMERIIDLDRKEREAARAAAEAKGYKAGKADGLREAAGIIEGLFAAYDDHYATLALEDAQARLRAIAEKG